MIRKTWSKDKWLLTAQCEHARLSGLMAASWNFPGEKPCDEAIYAIGHHDDGWKEADAHPRIDNEGQPENFDQTPLHVATEIWHRSAQNLADHDKRYGASLVSGHFLKLIENANMARMAVRDAVAMGKYMGQERNRAEHARNNDMNSDNPDNKSRWEAFDQNLRFLQVMDLLSLYLCTDFTGEANIENVPYLADGKDSIKIFRKGTGLTLSLDPLPFKKNVRDHLTSWMIPSRPLTSTKELTTILEASKPVTNEIHLGAM